MNCYGIWTVNYYFSHSAELWNWDAQGILHHSSIKDMTGTFFVYSETESCVLRHPQLHVMWHYKTHSSSEGLLSSSGNAAFYPKAYFVLHRAEKMYVSLKNMDVCRWLFNCPWHFELRSLCTIPYTASNPVRKSVCDSSVSEQRCLTRRIQQARGRILFTSTDTSLMLL